MVTPGTNVLEKGIGAYKYLDNRNAEMEIHTELLFINCLTLPILLLFSLEVSEDRHRHRLEYAGVFPSPFPHSDR